MAFFLKTKIWQTGQLEWWGWIEERFGARPTLKFFDHYVTVDNAGGAIRVDGEPVKLDDASEAAE